MCLSLFLHTSVPGTGSGHGAALAAKSLAYERSNLNEKRSLERCTMSYQFSSSNVLTEEITYLESFIESVSASLPAEVRRNLEHLSDLDQVSSGLMERWRGKQDRCVKGVEDALIRHFTGARAKEQDDQVDSNKEDRFHDGKINGDIDIEEERSAKRQKTDDLRAVDEDGSGSVLSPNNILERDPPTKLEIKQALDRYNPSYRQDRQEIKEMYDQLQQYSREKIDTADQLEAMCDAVLGRIDRDLNHFQNVLGISAEAEVAASSETSNALSGLANEHSHLLKAVGSAPSSARSANHRQSMAVAPAAPPIAAIARRAATMPIDGSTSGSDAPSTSKLLAASPASSADLAAIQTSPNSPDWILARIIKHDRANRLYRLRDVDDEEVVYTIPQKQVIPLKGTEYNQWTRGDTVYAVYPDTTSFYKAVVSTVTDNGYVCVHFQDDKDDDGVTHEKCILAQHVTRLR